MQRLVVTAVLAALLSIVGAGTSAIANAQINPRYTTSIEGTFEDVYDEFKNAIINEGLTIDYVGNVDQMLERTSQAQIDTDDIDQNLKQVTPVYLFAKYMQFCSSALTHKAVQANPNNLSMCPFLVFIYETNANPGRIIIGYRPPTLSTDKASKAISQEVVLFLNGIINEVASNY
jgi:uncharacterized protein (DUF302 family)